jgi:TolB-like protein
MKNLRVLAGFAVIMALVSPGGLNAQSSVSLDDGIQQSAVEIEGRLTSGSKIVVLNFTSPSVRLADYVIDELTGFIVNRGKLVVVDRQNLALIQQEMNFQLSGEVSDDSAQEIGRKLGAQSIISGSIEDLGQYYRLRFRVIEVVSAAIQLQPSKNVRKDSQITNLMRDAPAILPAAASAVSAAAAYPYGLNYSTGHKVGAGFLNMFFVGVGSFTMGDWLGGLLVGGLQITGNILIWSGVAAAAAATVETYYDDPYGYGGSDPSGSSNDGTGQIVAGLLILLAQSVTGFIVPFTYDIAKAKKNGTYMGGLDNPMKNIHITMIPGGKGAAAMNFTWAFRY